MSEQTAPTPADLVIRQQDLVENPDPRIPVCLLLDASASMAAPLESGATALEELNRALKSFLKEMLNDPNARKSADICIISFSDEARILRDFAPLIHRDADLSLTSVGSVTSLGKGLHKALELLDRRKAEFQAAGLDYYQPWLCVITDGAPTDNIHEDLIEDIRQRVSEKKLSVFPIAVGEFDDLSALSLISPSRPPMRLKGTAFRELFEWLSKSVARVSSSIPGETVPLDPKGLEAWAQV